MPDLECRMARIEQRLDQHMDDEVNNRDEFLNALNEIKEYQIKQRSFIGGVTFTIGSLFAVLAAGISYFGKGA